MNQALFWIYLVVRLCLRALSKVAAVLCSLHLCELCEQTPARKYRLLVCVLKLLTQRIRALLSIAYLLSNVAGELCITYSHM